MHSLITTEIINPNRYHYLKEYFLRWVGRYSAVIIITLVFCLVAGIQNPAFYYLCAILLFIVYPTGILAVLSSNAFNLRTVMLTTFPHEVHISDNEVEIFYHPLTRKDTDGECVVVYDKTPVPEIFPISSILSISITASETIIEGPQKNMILIIPAEAYRNIKDMLQAETILSSKIQK